MDRKCKQMDCDKPLYWKKPFCTGCLHKNVQYWKCETCNVVLDSAHNSILKKRCTECSIAINRERCRQIAVGAPRTRGYIKSGIYKGYHERRKRLIEKHPELIGNKELVVVVDL